MHKNVFLKIEERVRAGNNCNGTKHFLHFD
jgi:hypothetical protein